MLRTRLLCGAWIGPHFCGMSDTPRERSTLKMTLQRIYGVYHASILVVFQLNVSSSIIRGLAINILQLNLQDLDLDTLAAWTRTAHFFNQIGWGKERKITWDSVRNPGTCGRSVAKSGLEQATQEIWSGDSAFGRFAQEND